MGPNPPHQVRIYKLQLVSTLIQTYGLLIVINSFSDLVLFCKKIGITLEGSKQKGPDEANQIQALSERELTIT
jgi:hypothetical protein